MSEKRMDRLLNIKTTGIRDWPGNFSHYNRNEATPYRALEILFEHITFSANDHFVDVGAGSGRFSIYLHYRFGVAVTGIEAHRTTYLEAERNRSLYVKKYPQRNHLLTFIKCRAEDFTVISEMNFFYFFNPFSITIFRMFINKVMASFYEFSRPIKLILYFPLSEFIEFLQMETMFVLVDTIIVDDDHHEFGKFLVYQLT